MALLFLYLFVVMGAIIGVNEGYEADSAADTEIYIEGDTLVAGDNTTNISFNVEDDPESDAIQAVENDSLIQFAEWVNERTPRLLPRSIEHRIEAGALTATEHAYWTIMRLVMGVADSTATWTYHNQWLPVPIVKTVFNAAAIGPLVGIGYLQVRRVKELTAG